MSAHFGCYEQILTTNGTISDLRPNPIADFLFIAIQVSRINVSVAQVDGILNSLFALCASHLNQAKSQSIVSERRTEMQSIIVLTEYVPRPTIGIV